VSTTTTERVRARLLSEFTRRQQLKPRMTMEKLLRDSGLGMNRSSLHKKLHGDIGLTIDEAQAIGRVLGVTVTVNVKRAA
jgi:hypothetical protein